MLKFKPLSLLIALNVLSATAEDVIQPASGQPVQQQIAQPMPQPVVNNYYYAPANQPSVAPAQPVAVAPQVATPQVAEKSRGSDVGSHGFFIGGGYTRVKTDIEIDLFDRNGINRGDPEKADVVNQVGFVQIGFKTKAMPLFVSGSMSVYMGSRDKLADKRDEDEDTGYNASLKQVFDMQLNLGLEIHPAVSVYGIVGARGYQLETDLKIPNISKRETFNGANVFYGGGLELLLHKNLFIFGEYTVGSKASETLDDKLDFGGGFTPTLKYSIEKSEAIKVGVRYYFK